MQIKIHASLIIFFFLDSIKKKSAQLHKSALLDRQIEKILPNRKIVLQLFLLELAHV